MRWTPGRRSANIEDRRGMSVGRGVGIGGGLIALLLSLLFGADIFTPGTDGEYGVEQPTTDAPVRSTPEEERLVLFVSFVLDSTQSTWTQIFPALGTQYRNARLVLFRDAVQSACGIAGSATGPFYCPPDERVYVDLGFFDELRARFGAPGDFAQAYVLAHEIGHHVQNLLGIEQQVRAGMQRGGRQANELSVRLELQADCLAGIWGHRAARQGLLEPGDVEEGIGAAAAVGDDRIQRLSTGQVSPESWTHGSSAQRVAWFRRGLESGQVRDCDTFGRR
jgi:predicted metalloprotease